MRSIASVDPRRSAATPVGLLRAVLIALSIALTISGTASAQGQSVVDVLVVWTDRAEASAGGAAQVQEAIRNAIVYTNLTRASSYVNQNLRLVHAQRIAYDETSTARIEDDIAHLALPDAVLDEVLTLRETYGADLVSMVVNRAPVVCGAAERLGAAPADRLGFSVVDVTCLPYALAHETAHNAGAGHETGPGLYDYSRAFVSSVNGQPERCGTAVSAPAGQLLMPFYSNPDIRFRFGSEPFLLGRTPEPEIVSPVPSSLLVGPDVTFTWDARGFPVMEWWLTIGSAPGAVDIYDSGPIGATASHTVTAAFPVDGSPVFARLYFWNPYSGLGYTEAVYNLTVGWAFISGQNTLMKRNPVTQEQEVLAVLPGFGVSIAHTGGADYRRFFFTVMMAQVPSGGSAIYMVNILTGDLRSLQHGNGEPMWVRPVRDGLHAVVVEVGPNNTRAEIFVFDQATGATQPITHVDDVGNVRQYGNFVERTDTAWVLHFVGTVDSQDTEYQIPLETGGPCYGLPAGAPLADNARTLRETASTVASFRPSVVGLSYVLAVATTGPGAGTVAGAGVYPADTLVTLTATPDSNSVFGGFGGHPDCHDGVVLMVADRVCEVRFESLGPGPYSLRVVRAGRGSGRVTSSPAGIDCGTDCEEEFDGGSVSLTAVAGSGSTFSGWSGDADCSDGTVTMTRPRLCFARFSLPVHRLTITKVGTGIGTVVSDVVGIDCGTDCTQAYRLGMPVTLTANPDALSVFSHWSGAADCSDGQVTMTADMTCTATFVRLYRLTVSRAGSGGGHVNSDIAGILCGSDCDQQYLIGTVVRLSATPSVSSFFEGWSGDPDCVDGTLTMTGDIACVATFTRHAVPRRVLVDASRSDAVWWSPQMPPFDPAQPHRGKAIIDALSNRGAAVVERATAPTCEEISQSHLVVVSERTAWLQRDISAYIRYVLAGGRLILLEDLNSPSVDGQSALASALGLSFTGFALGQYPMTLSPHAITNGSTVPFLDGRLLGSWPAHAQILGRLTGVTGTPASMGLMSLGAGLVFFSGDTEALYSLPQPFFDNLFGYMLSDAPLANACAAPFTDDPIVPGVTVVRSIHVTELRQRVDAARVASGLTTFAWTDVSLPPVVRAVHIVQLRTALSQAYLARGLAVPAFSDPGLGAGTPIRAAHVRELREAVAALE